MNFEKRMPNHTGDPQLFRVDLGSHKAVSRKRANHGLEFRFYAGFFALLPVSRCPLYRVEYHGHRDNARSYHRPFPIVQPDRCPHPVSRQAFVTQFSSRTQSSNLRILGIESHRSFKRRTEYPLIEVRHISLGHWAGATGFRTVFMGNLKVCKI